MKYYIYPNGKVGQDIQRIFEKCNFRSEFYMVDDCFIESSSKNMRDAVVLISSQKHYFELAQKCTKLGLAYINGMKFAANVLNEFISSISAVDKNIAVILAGPAGNKHRGKVLLNLTRGGV